MSQLDWSQIARQQDNYTHEYDRKQQQQKQILKQMYKNELLKMINEHKNKMEDEKNGDKSLIKWQNEKQRAKQMLQKEERDRKQRAKQEMARYNYEAGGDKKNKLSIDHEQTNKFYSSKFKKAMTEAQQQQKSRIVSQEHKKQELSRAYESQIMHEKNRKIIEKMQDKKFNQMREQIERKKQKNRKMYFNKLRNFKQNPEVYEHSRTLLVKAEQNRNQFIEKLIQDDRNAIYEQQKQRQQQRKSRQLHQVGKFNRNYYENKALRQRLQSMQQVHDFHMKYATLENEMMAERKRKLREKQEQKRILKQELEKQIQYTHLKQSRRNRLSEKQQKINRSGHIATLPGISNDFSSEKHQKIMYNFLGGRSSKSVQREY